MSVSDNSKVLTRINLDMFEGETVLVNVGAGSAPTSDLFNHTEVNLVGITEVSAM